jgi:ribosomal protein S18 acetylase RimI-like enzyme
MHVRDARPGDGLAFEQIRVAGWKAAYAGLLDQQLLDELSVEDARVAHREETIAAPSRGELILMAEDEEGDVLGVALLLPVRDDDLDDAAELAALYVDPDRRYRGAGSALLTEGFRRMPQPTQVLWVLEDNAPARRFYERHGFVLDGTRKAAERIPGSPVEVRYRRARLA